MDSVAVTVPLRPPTKKMKKRKELDALAPPHAVSRRSSGKRSSQELLSESSDERSEYWNVSTRGVGAGRKGRPAGSGRSACPGLMRACSVFLAGVIVLVTTVLVWLFIDVRQQLTALRVELDQVIAGSEGVPDALQTCHTLDRNFKTNLTHITDEIQKLNTSLNSFSGQITHLQQELQQVQVSLKSAPELTSVPSTVKALQESIGQLEFDIHELKTSTKMLQDTTSVLQNSTSKQGRDLNEIQETLMSLSNRAQQPQMVPTNESLIETKKIWDALSELSKNVTNMNQTLTTNITWAQEDVAKNYKMVLSLQDMAQNASTQTLTLQQECVKRKDYESLQDLMRTLSAEVKNLSSKQERPEQSAKFIAPKNVSDPLMASLMNAQSQTDTGKTNGQSSIQKNTGNSENATQINLKSSVADASETLPETPSPTTQ